VDSYVTTKAMDALFKKIAEEEKRIRENPVARTTDLLKDVFGKLSALGRKFGDVFIIRPPKPAAVFV
jgi:hypothetical protein